MKQFSTNIGLAIFVSVSAGACATLAAAQSADGAAASQPAASSDPVNQVGDIVITAERRSTSLSKTAIAVTAVDRQLIEQGGLQQIRDLEGQVPGLTTPGSIPNMQSSFLRGIGTSDAGAYQAVGIYIDDVYLPRVFGNALFDLPDLRQIEVLRGPQASLYGQNTTAGVIKFVTQDPGDDVRIQGDVSVGDFDYRQVHGLVSGPIVAGKLSGSLAFGSRRQGGYIYNSAIDRDVNRISTDQIRGKLRFTPNDAYTAVLSIDWAEDHSDNATFTPVTGSVPYNDPSYDPRNDVPLYGKRENRAYPLLNNNDIELGRFSGGASLIQSWQVNDALQLKSTSAARYLRDDPSPWDYDGTPLPIRDFVQHIDEDYFYQELQGILSLDRLTLIGGATAFREHFGFSRYSIAARPAAVGYTYSDLVSKIVDKNIAGYLNASYLLTDKLKATVGLRYGTETQNYSNRTESQDAAGNVLSVPVNVAGVRESWESFTPKVTLDYQVTPNLLTYVSYSEGQRTGGYDRNAASNTLAASTPTRPETVATYEGGVKWRSENGRFVTSVAVFYNDFKDYISSISNPTVDGVALVGALPINAGDAYTQGIEFEAAWRVTSRFDVRVTGLLVEGEFDRSYNDAFTGNEIPFLTPQVFGVNLGYRLPTSRNGTFNFNLNAKYIAEYYSDIGNTLAYVIPERTAVNGRVEWNPPRGNYSISANILNLFDDQSSIRRAGYRINSVVPIQTENEISYAEPRRFFVTLAYKY